MENNRIEKLLAAILVNQMKGETVAEKAQALTSAGMSASEVAALLGTSAGVIRQLLYERRKKKGRK
jgi:DNA-binding CsgD family transcriptional regulator